MEGVPSTLYGVYKRANEGTATVFAAERGVPSVGLRPHTVYGVARDQGLTSAPDDGDAGGGGRPRLRGAVRRPLPAPARGRRGARLRARGPQRRAGRAGAQPARAGRGNGRDHRRDRGRGARDGRPAQLLAARRSRSRPPWTRAASKRCSGRATTRRWRKGSRPPSRASASCSSAAWSRSRKRATGPRARVAARPATMATRMPALLCDVGPRDGLQNDPAIARRPRRAPSCAGAWPPPGCRASRRRASCTRSSCPRWPARRRCSARSTRPTACAGRRSCSTGAGSSARSPPARARCMPPIPSPTRSRSATRT